MFGLGTTELIVILVLVLIVFGVGKLPQVGGAMGKSLRNFKEGMKAGSEDDQDVEVKQLEEKDSDEK